MPGRRPLSASRRAAPGRARGHAEGAPPARAPSTRAVLGQARARPRTLSTVTILGIKVLSHILCSARVDSNKTAMMNALAACFFGDDAADAATDTSSAADVRRIDTCGAADVRGGNEAVIAALARAREVGRRRTFHVTGRTYTAMHVAQQPMMSTHVDSPDTTPVRIAYVRDGTEFAVMHVDALSEEAQRGLLSMSRFS